MKKSSPVSGTPNLSGLELSSLPFFDFVLETDVSGVIKNVLSVPNGSTRDLGICTHVSLAEKVAPLDLPYFTMLLNMINQCGMIPERALNLLDPQNVPLAYRMKAKRLENGNFLMAFEKDPIGAARLFEISYQDSQYPSLVQVVPFVIDQAVYCQALQMPLMIVLLQFDRSNVSKRDMILLEGWLKAWSIQGIGGFEFDSGRLANLCQWSEPVDQLKEHLERSFLSTDIPAHDRFEIQVIDLSKCDPVAMSTDPIKALYQILADHELQVLYSATSHQAQTSQASVQKRMSDYVDQQHFHILYQPVVSLPDLSLHHYEALARLKQNQDTEAALIKAEEMGMANELDDMICQKIIAELSEYQQKLGHCPKTALNISAQSLVNDVFIDRFQKMMAVSSLKPDDILLEITETYVIRDFEKASNVVRNLRRRGHPICLDDVGSGSTSFQSFYNLEVDYAKIDGKCLHRAMTDERYMSILRSIMTICQELFITVIAEQVETQAHLDFVEWLEIKLGQGFFLGKPGPL